MSASRVSSDARRSTSNVWHCVVMGRNPLGGQTYPGELPASRGLKEVAIGGSHMISGGDAGPSPQNHLTGHELAVVFAQGPRNGLVAWIPGVGAGRPFPTVSEDLLNTHTGGHGRMKPTGVEQVSLRGCLGRGAFPFRFRGQPTTSPARKCIALEETYVAHGRIKQQGKSVPAPQREHPPARSVIRITFPIQRRLPTRMLHDVPSLREPEFGACVHVIRHELKVLTAGHLSICHLEGFQVDPVAGSLVIEAKVQRVLNVKLVTDLSQATFHAVPAELGD